MLPFASPAPRSGRPLRIKPAGERRNDESFAETLTSAEAGSDVPLYFNVHTAPFPAGEIRGQWVAGDASEQPDDAGEQPVDWEALAARVLAFHEATGSWGLLSDWLSETPTDVPHGGQEEQPATPGDTAGGWHL